ncbi:hypothetical protein BHE74_00036098 [Ensete ventricosum]|nr:hypothetical protein GW17_00054587 [Ensete ventricosum]RWW57137.1 hypothetical protein BHE74_00036098 [Ensete ventricosum]
MDGAVKVIVSSQHYQMALFDRVHDVGRVITSMDNKVDLLRREVQRLKEGGDPEVVAAVEGRASEVQSLKEVQALLLVPKMLGDYSPCRVHKLVHVSQEWGNSIGVGSTSREPAPRVGFFGNRSRR